MIKFSLLKKLVTSKILTMVCLSFTMSQDLLWEKL